MKRFLALLLIFLYACQSPPPCYEQLKYLHSKSCNLVIEKQNDFGARYVVSGYEPVTKYSRMFDATGGLYITIRSHAVVGDTIIKMLDESYFTLKKRNFNIKFDTKCNGSDYVSSPPDTISKY